MNSYLRYTSLFVMLCIASSIFAQKKGKVPPYEPVTGVAEADVAPLIFASLEELNNSASSALSKEDIRLVDIDMAGGTYKTNYIHYVAMMMHRRVKAEYQFKDGKIEIEMTDIAVQNQNNGGAWEESKMAVKGDKKIQSKLALKIKELNSNPEIVTAARKAFYANLDNVYEIMKSGSPGNYSAQSELLKAGVSAFDGGLEVIDADFNHTKTGKGKYQVEYQYLPKTAPEGAKPIKFLQYTDDQQATALGKKTNLTMVKKCWVEEVKNDGTIVFGSQNITMPSYAYNQLTDTEPISGMMEEDAFVAVYSVLKSEGIGVTDYNPGYHSMTSSWVDIKDGKLGGENHALITFLYADNMIHPFYIQMMDSNNKNTTCLSKACREYKIMLSDKIRELRDSGTIETLRADFYADETLNEIMLQREHLTTLRKKLWEQNMP